MRAYPSLNARKLSPQSTVARLSPVIGQYGSHAHLKPIAGEENGIVSFEGGVDETN